MAVTSLRTSIEDFTAATFTNYGGGAGASSNTDIFIEGSQSGGRRVDNALDAGFGVSVASTDLSAAGVHVKVWVWVTQWAQVTQVQLRISDGINDDDHELPVGEYPDLGGWLPAWVDVSRTPEVGGSANEASLTEFGVLLDIGNVGGNASNLIIDEITSGTSGLRWDGSSGTLTSFATFENTNREGVLITQSGVRFCYARLEIGSATATTFADSSFQLVFPNQSLVATTFMGLTFDLQNVSTVVALSDAVITSGNVASATNRPDIQVTGASGTLSLDGMTVTGMRTLSLTSGVTIDNSTVQTLDLTQNGAEILNSVVQTASASTVACITDATFGVSSGIHDTVFAQAGTGHAVQIAGTTTVTLTNLTGLDASGGYGTTGSNDAAIYFSASTGSITVNLAGTPIPTYRTAGVVVTFVASYTLTLTGIPSGVQVTIVNSATRAELQNSTSVGSDVTYIHSGGETVDVLFMATQYDPNISDIYDLTLPSADNSIPLSFFDDGNYVNP